MPEFHIENGDAERPIVVGDHFVHALAAENDDGGEGTNARLVDFPITAPGTYYIHAVTYSGEGDYTLSLEITE